MKITMPNWWDVGLREEPALGAHLVSPRIGYNHHGIYVGNGNVVHYAGLAGSFHFGPVEETSIACFAARHKVWAEASPCPTCTEDEAVEWARSRLGEDRYRLLTNNCEHFYAWCLYGQSRSEQVHDCLTHPRAAVQVLVGFLRAVLSAMTAINVPATPRQVGTSTGPGQAMKPRLARAVFRTRPNHLSISLAVT